MLRNIKTPLFVRIDLPRNFPVSRPNLVVLSRVVHNDLHPETKVVTTQLLQQWDIYKFGSNLLTVLRDIHARWDASPPIPEKIIN
mgnify:CR=1 FL=1